jgi:hypothetical protein
MPSRMCTASGHAGRDPTASDRGAESPTPSFSPASSFGFKQDRLSIYIETGRPITNAMHTAEYC